MTFQEAHKDGKNGLVARRNLTEVELESRLKNYFSDKEILSIIVGAKSYECWTDGNVVVVCTYGMDGERFIAIADGNYMDLIEP